MKDTNNTVLVGRLVRDAEMKYTDGGTAVCKFAIAVNDTKKDGEKWVEEADFFDVTLWGKSGESLNQYLVKGKQVAVVGRLKQDRWEKDGKTQSKVYIKAENVQLLGGGKQSDSSSGSNSVPAAADGGFPSDIPF